MVFSRGTSGSRYYSGTNLLGRTTQVIFSIKSQPAKLPLAAAQAKDPRTNSYLVGFIIYLFFFQWTPSFKEGGEYSLVWE